MYCKTKTVPSLPVVSAKGITVQKEEICLRCFDNNEKEGGQLKGRNEDSGFFSSSEISYPFTPIRFIFLSLLAFHGFALNLVFSLLNDTYQLLYSAQKSVAITYHYPRGLFIALLLGGAINFLYALWLYLAYKALKYFITEQIRFSPLAVLGITLIPGINLLFSFSVMSELWSYLLNSKTENPSQRKNLVPILSALAVSSVVITLLGLGIILISNDRNVTKVGVQCHFIAWILWIVTLALSMHVLTILTKKLNWVSKPKTQESLENNHLKVY